MREKRGFRHLYENLMQFLTFALIRNIAFCLPNFTKCYNLKFRDLSTDVSLNLRWHHNNRTNHNHNTHDVLNKSKYIINYIAETVKSIIFTDSRKNFSIQYITKFFALSKRRKSRKKSSDDKKIGDLEKKSGNSRISRQTLDMYDF